MANKQTPQWQIDTLLEKVGGSAPSGKRDLGVAPATADHQIAPYDFRHPSRFSKDHLRALQTIHERFVRTVASSLTSYLRLNVRLQLTTVQQAIFDEYVEQLPHPTVIYVLRMPPLEGPVVLELNLSPTMATLDRLCGGPGTAIDTGRPLTEVEQALLQPISRHLLRAMADAWTGVARLNPALEDTLLNPRVLRAIAPNEIIALLVMEWEVGDVTGTMSLCIPHLTLEPIMDRLQSQAWLADQHRADREAVEQHLRGRLLETPMEVTVELGTIDLPASTLLTLQEGDVIRLNTPAQGELTVRVANRPMFRGRAGVASGNVAVQIADVIGNIGLPDKEHCGR